MHWVGYKLRTFGFDWIGSTKNGPVSNYVLSEDLYSASPIDPPIPNALGALVPCEQ